MRINKFLSQAEVCSRREADRLIKENKVTVDGCIASLGDDVNLENEICVNGIKVDSKHFNEKKVILLYNKPPGLICSSSSKDGETVFDRINYPKRLFYAGRLDKYSRGLLVLTNDGDVANRIIKGKNAHEREYEVTVNKFIENDVIAAFQKGVYIKELDRKTRPCRVKRLSDKSFSITLTQGLNRQIRRMCEAFGLHVIDLCRVRIERANLGKLKEGTYKKIRAEELFYADTDTK